MLYGGADMVICGCLIVSRHVGLGAMRHCESRRERGLQFYPVGTTSVCRPLFVVMRVPSCCISCISCTMCKQGFGFTPLCGVNMAQSALIRLQCARRLAFQLIRASACFLPSVCCYFLQNVLLSFWYHR